MMEESLEIFEVIKKTILLSNCTKYRTKIVHEDGF